MTRCNFYWQKLILIVTAFLFVTQLKAQTVVLEHGQLWVKGNKIVDQYGTNTQLRGMSLFWSQWQGKYYAYNTIKWLRDDWKCTVVRAAMAVDNGGYSTNKAAEQAKVEAVVDAAIALGIYVIIDFHCHVSSNYMNEAKTFFNDMSLKYAGKPNVIYELWNEPLNVTWDGVIKPYCETIAGIIRKNDSLNLIICGTQNWSQKVLDAANNPITTYKNIAYTLHYYAASHGQALRTEAENAMAKGAALFVTEQGTCDASGNGNFDITNSNIWWDWCDKNNVSWCNWSVSDKVETASVINPNASVDGNWKTTDLTQSGVFVRNELIGSYVPPVVADKPPFITSQPQSVFLPNGSATTLSVASSSITTMTYQWKKNGIDIPNATTASLVFTSIAYSDTATYTVAITNAIGTTLSNPAIITIGISQPYSGLPIAIPGRLEAENYDKGGELISYHDTEPANQGKTYRLTDGVDIETTTDIGTGYNIGYFVAGEWMSYTVNVANNGTYDVTFRVATTTTTGKLGVSVDGVTKIASVNAPNTTGWQIWQNVTVPDVALTAGIHTLRITDIVGNINLNYVDFVTKKVADCHGDINGTAYYDDCKICVGGTTGLTACVSQTIKLNQGWNLISTNVRPTDSSIVSLFNGLDVLEIKTLDAFWAKGQMTNFNGLNTITAGNGYFVKMNTAGTLTVNGSPLNTSANYPINTLKPGWNLIGCPYQTAKTMTSLFTGNTIIVVKNFEGFWYSNGTVNSLLNIEPNKGYFLKK